MEWVENLEIGTRDRIMKVCAMKDIKLYLSPNNIIVLQKLKGNIFCLCKENDIVKKNTVFMKIDEFEYSLDFKFKMIEIGNNDEYCAIILKLDENTRKKYRNRRNKPQN